MNVDEGNEFVDEGDECLKEMSVTKEDEGGEIYIKNERKKLWVKKFVIFKLRIIYGFSYLFSRRRIYSYHIN